MTCACEKWDEIHGFTSPSEYERFVRWLNEQEAAGVIEMVPVGRRYNDSSLFEEQWVRCVECTQVWRVVAPDPPFRGVFEKVTVACSTCEAALPLLQGIPVVATSESYHSTLFRCPSCGTYYEQVAEEWRGPHVLTEQEVRMRYPDHPQEKGH